MPKPKSCPNALAILRLLNTIPVREVKTTVKDIKAINSGKF